MNTIILTKDQANDLAKDKKVEIEIDGKIHILQANYDFVTKNVFYDNLTHYEEFIVKDLTINEFYKSITNKIISNTPDITLDPFNESITLCKVKRVKTTITVEKWQIVE